MKIYTKVVAIMSTVVLFVGMAGSAQADEAAVDGMAMEKRMQRLEDREAIGEVLVTYGRLLDKKDLVGYSFVPITPFGIKDWEKWDVPDEKNTISLQRKRLDGVVSYTGTWSPTTLSSENKESIRQDLTKEVYTANSRRTIYAIHTPPSTTSLDRISIGHVGSIAVREFIEQHKPLATLHGHIHETVDITGAHHERIGETECYSCGNHNTTEHVMAILLDTKNMGNGERIRI